MSPKFHRGGGGERDLFFSSKSNTVGEERSSYKNRDT